ncbi:LacI family transcriptional regulator [Pseudoclavibacter sp. RFBJ3]|uniref:LacI family DNA-binding transcriptional regulator n=2 Tax=unclassified Pseudoclavibacter TaxID=2615177 RepID=UPI000CE7AAB8|nr:MULTISPECIES: LacI family DNA-binding transcriptional regulator [unclassified Pseudoclavibacter]PPF82657.1 LacI family transcriptional regulator [Pseudoclavibacter sp. RFBJ5]PPF91551.1 LacI family transcriptional regulator [Pseudoclavibacter sp. RFBJ3]PPF96474.1 LacI family transcriptional regulator [Pseudoclavibacter sp. RFBH5]PPG22219.1 LacI family transcriptional regulator [Pseudoclavibacter sp. RFBI4]
MNSSEHPKNGPPVTMREVAKAAGVSVATVSHVVNNKKGARIGEDARRRVQHVVAELGYRPNALAKTLSRGTSRFIGLVADAIATTPFAGQIIHGAQDEAWKHGYILLVANTESNAAAESEAIAMMLEHQVHGILYSTWYHRGITPPEGLEKTETVLVNCYALDGGYPAVVPDEYQGGRAATAALLAAGHQRIAFINTTTESPAQSGRLAGYRAALEASGVPFDDSLVFPASPQQEGGYASTDGVLRTGATGVFCHNDRVAMGLYDGLRERGLRIPEDIAVMGFDNQDVIAAHLRPPLSTVALPHYELGAQGVRLLLGLESSTPDSPQLIDCPPIARSSV